MQNLCGRDLQAATNGEINCLDTGGFGALTIIKSISVVCDYTEGDVLSANVNGFIVNASAGSIVTLKGQDVECIGTGINGIEIVNVGVTLHVHKTQIGAAAPVAAMATALSSPTVPRCKGVGGG